MSLLRLNDLHKSFNDGSRVVHAVDGLSLTVSSGELMVLVGPSGCGKTTALRLLAGLEIADAGTIHMDDREVTSQPPKDRNVAMVFQDGALYAHLTVAENLAFPLEMRRESRTDVAQRVADMAARLGLTPLLDRRPAMLSGGEQQRVALGRALIRRPAAVLLDEPLSSLDASLRMRMRVEIKSIQQAWGTTMVLVTHDQEEAMSMAHRMAVMRDGTICQTGTPAEVYSKPSCRFVAEFLGRLAMNLLSGVLAFEGRKAFFACAVGRFDLGAGHADWANGGSAVLGVRPEHMRLESGVASKNASESTLSTQPLTVESVETLGDRQSVHLTGGATVTTAASQTVRVGDPVRCCFDRQDIHLFDADDAGARIN